VRSWMVASLAFDEMAGVTMEYEAEADPIGVVEGQEGSSIRLADWVARIQSDPRLRPPDPVPSVNPFDRRPMTITPHPGTVYVWEEKHRIGMMAWSEEGLDEIVVYGASPQVVAIAEEVARDLGGRFRRLGVE